MSVEEFDKLHSFLCHEISTKLDPWNKLGERRYIKVHKKKLDSKEMLLFFLEMLDGSSYGTRTLKLMSDTYKISISAGWKYFSHTAWAVFRALKKECPIEWPSIEERQSMKGLFPKFPDTIMFVDGSKQFIQRSVYKDKQNDQFDGRKKDIAIHI